MKRAVRVKCALLILALGCSSTHSAGETGMNVDMGMDMDMGMGMDMDMDMDIALEDAALDGSRPEPAACGAADEILNLRDSDLGTAFFDANDACEQRLHQRACGDLRLALDAQGCVTDVQGISSIAGDAALTYRDCLVAELSPSCSRCEHDVAARVYYSCTIQ